MFSGLFPDVKEKADNFILYIGDQSQGRAGFDCNFDGFELSAIIGAYDEKELNFIIKSLDDRKLIERLSTTDFQKARLSFEGWDRFHELKQLKVDSRRAFMAMPFGKADVNTAYRDCFQPAVKQTGFRLEKLDEKPEAGSIPDRMAVELRRSRFVIADLSYENRGAYWEAGFAEGLGRPVIYTCNVGCFGNIHFDTKHLHTIKWDVDNLIHTAEELKTTIRATLPEEALLDDPT